MSEDFVPTPVGTARITWYPGAGIPRSASMTRTTTASNAATGSGVSRSGASASISPTT